MQSRVFRYADAVNSRLADNAGHQFAMRYAISIYPLNAIYTFIPKNACSTLRFSAAIANGVLSETSDVNWIHSNNQTFNPTLQYALQAKFRFVVLRCPYRRLASAYLNKVVDTPGGTRNKLPFSRMQHLMRRIRRQKFFDSWTFEDFCALLARAPTDGYNAHWRPQVDFLLYREYDQYLSVEDFSAGEKILQDAGLQVHDTRAALKHDTSHLKKVTGDFARVPASEIRRLKAEGGVPTYDAMFNDATRKFVQDTFAADLEIYRQRISPAGLLFD